MVHHCLHPGVPAGGIDPRVWPYSSVLRPLSFRNGEPGLQQYRPPAVDLICPAAMPASVSQARTAGSAQRPLFILVCFFIGLITISQAVGCISGAGQNEYCIGGDQGCALQCVGTVLVRRRF